MYLHPAQSSIAKDLHRFRVLNCGRRFGKTVLAIEEMIGVAVAKKDRRVSYFAPTRDDAKEITWAMLIKQCENIITNKNETLLQIKIMTIDGGESIIALYGWQSVQERGKGRGLANDFIVCDEVSSYKNFWSGWDEVLSPTLIDRKGQAMFISTPKGFNHFYDLMNMEVKDPNFKSFHFTSFDNPHIPREELERERLTKPEDTFAQEYLADFRKATGLVYKEFDRTRHVTDELPTSWDESIAGIDFGFTNPTAVIHVKVINGAYFVTEEWYKTGRTEEQIATYVASCNFNRVYADPESPSAIEVLHTKGIATAEVVKNKDSIKNGISAVRQLFRANRIRIHNSCVNLINELETYSYDEKREGQNENENPIKEHDHALDALRYAISSNQPMDWTDYGRVLENRSKNRNFI